MRPDIIFTDMKMPRRNGVELISKLREDGIASKVIVISAYDNYNFIHNSLKLGVSDYLLKPIKADELNNQLIDCIRQLKARDKPMGKNRTVQPFFRKDGKIFEDLCGLILKKSKHLSKDMVITIYYNLMGLLQRYITANQISNFISSHEGFYVFGNGSDAKNVLSHIQTLFFKCFEAKKQNDNKTKFDINKVLKFIQLNYTKGIALEEAADVFGISKEYLSKKFKEQTGEGFSEYVTSFRMNKAKELICEYHMPLKEVCEQTGYVELTHFHKVFKRYFGKTPKEMRGED